MADSIQRRRLPAAQGGGPLDDDVLLHDHLRFLAYTRVVRVLHGYLGFKNRVVVSSCLKWLIRDKFPSEHGDYVGFMKCANPY